MKSGEKKGILILVLIAVVILAIVFFINKNKGSEVSETQTQTQTTVENKTEGNIIEKTEFTVTKDNGVTVNTSNKLNEDKEFFGFVISNVTFSEKNGDSELVAFVTNKTGSDQSAFPVEIVLLGKDGSEVGRIPASIVSTSAGETIQIRAKITENYVDAYDFKLEKKN